MEKSIYTMELHERIVVKTTDTNPYMIIIRVPGGWLYKIDRDPPVFVPYVNDAKP